MAPEAGQLLEFYPNGVSPTREMIASLPRDMSLRVWDPLRKQMAFIYYDDQGILKIRTGNLLAQEPEEYGITPDDALEDALKQWRRAKRGEAQMETDLIEQRGF